MQSMQRRFGKFLPRTADETQVAVLLKCFEEADKMLAKVNTSMCLHRLNTIVVDLPVR